MDILQHLNLRNYIITEIKWKILLFMLLPVSTQTKVNCHYDCISTLYCVSTESGCFYVCMSVCHRSVAHNWRRKGYLHIFPGTGQHPHRLHFQVQREELQGFSTFGFLMSNVTTCNSRRLSLPITCLQIHASSNKIG